MNLRLGHHNNTEGGRSQVKLQANLGTVWLTQLDMAELFDATKQNVSLHLKNIFEEGALDPGATVKESLTVQTEGTRRVERLVAHYNLDAILAVGYRVRSPRGVQFRRWASTALKEYLVKGFVMDDERLKNPDGRPDYFDEMLVRIRDIRASEKRFYQKVRELFALSSDYDKTEQAKPNQRLPPPPPPCETRPPPPETRSTRWRAKRSLATLAASPRC